MKEKLDEKIRRKRQEIQDFEGKIREANAYIQALEEASKLLPRDTPRPATGEMVLREGSGAHKAYLALQSAGKPLHITSIMKAIGMQNNRAARIALSGTLSRYSRNEQVFRRTAPNTFAIIDSQGSEEPSDDLNSILEEGADVTEKETESIFG